MCSVTNGTFKAFCEGIFCCTKTDVTVSPRPLTPPRLSSPSCASLNSRGSDFSSLSGSVDIPISSSSGYQSATSKLRSFFGSRRRLPVLTMRGNLNQVTIGGRYAGTQCTSMSLTALVALSMVKQKNWVPELLDNTIIAGNDSHITFRDVMKLSTHPDNRVALYDLPNRVRYKLEEHYHNANIQPVTESLFLKNTPKTKAFMMKSLYTYLKQKYAPRVDVLFCLITVGEYTYCFHRDEAKFWWLYDSHGHLKIPRTKRDINNTPPEDGSKLDGATITKFTSAKGMVELLLDNHKPSTPVEVREVTIIPDLDLSSLLQEEELPLSRLNVALPSSCSVFSDTDTTGRNDVTTGKYNIPIESDDITTDSDDITTESEYTSERVDDAPDYSSKTRGGTARVNSGGAG